MEFVNTIAQIVHMEVHLHDGSANKNIGNAFLLVWKFPPEVEIRDIFEALVAGAPAVCFISLSAAIEHRTGSEALTQTTRTRTPVLRVRLQCTPDRVSDIGWAVIQGNRAALVSSVADKALATFVIIQSMLRRSGKLREYQHNSALSERLPDYEVQMGFGLHVGWAIQGAIGSEYKVDASYLSPNINLASRLEVCPRAFTSDAVTCPTFASVDAVG
jgi:class 3 adenylate cyclase